MSITMLHVGNKLDSIQLDPVSRLDLIKYAGASGDFNPIHTIDEEATKAGLPGIIAHGMLTMGSMGKMFTPYLQEGFIREFSTRFSEMVFLQDVITLKAKLIEQNESIFHFQVEAVNQREEAVATGSIIFQRGDYQ